MTLLLNFRNFILRIIEARDKVGNTPLINLLNGIGGWPLIKPTWTESDFNLEKALVYIFTKVGIDANTIFQISAHQDMQNSSINILLIHPGHFMDGKSRLF